MLSNFSVMSVSKSTTETRSFMKIWVEALFSIIPMAACANIYGHA